VKKLGHSLFSIFILLLMINGCSANEGTESKGNSTSNQKKVELTVSAASSLQDALTEIKTVFEKENPTFKLIYNFGASGSLQQQISQGAPVDIFFSAAEDKFQKLVDAGLIEENGGIDLVENDLVLVVPKDSTKGIENFEDLTKTDKIALGIPESVPAGQYGKDTLENLNLWSAMEGKIVYAKDVRQVLTYVETTNVDAGIVYKTDALTSDKIKVVATAEESTHDPIIYPVGVIKNSDHHKEAEQFYQYLQGEKAMEILIKYGFKELN